MTRQFKYPEGHAEIGKPSLATLPPAEIYGLPPAAQGLMVGTALRPVVAAERYPPEVVALLCFGRGR